MKKLIHFGYMLVVCLSLLGCSMPASTRPHLSVRLDSPRSGMVVALPAEIFVYAEATVPAQNVTRMIFYANGLVIGEDTSPVPSGEFTSGIVHWSPTEPGEYLVQAEALRSDGSAFTAAARVCVLPAISERRARNFVFQQYGYTGPCEVPAPNPLTPRGSEVSMVVHAIPGSLAYNHSSCTASVATPTIAFEATVDDPSDRVAFVVVDYSVPSLATAGTVINDTIALNWTSSSSMGEKIFTGTTEDLTFFLQGELQADGGILTWTARALTRDGEVLAEDGPHDIIASPCVAAVIGAPMPLIVEWTPTFTPIPTETPTPTLVPYVPPTKKPDDGSGNPDGNGGSKCSSYSDKDSCSAAGCSWDPDKKACN